MNRHTVIEQRRLPFGQGSDVVTAPPKHRAVLLDFLLAVGRKQILGLAARR
jgi:hypothetical protein